MKKVLALLLVLIIGIDGICNVNMVSLAEESEEVPLETVMTEDALIGYMENQTWGVYLLNGNSVINDAGNGKIGWGGVTNAAYRCTVSTNAIVERKVGGSWVRVTSYTQTNTNALYAMVSRTLSVGSGYYYRVRCVHRANSDVSNSCTDALYM